MNSYYASLAKIASAEANLGAPIALEDSLVLKQLVVALGNVTAGGGGGGSGTVTSVAFTGGLISVATPTTTPALTVAGTSGGIPYFSSASTWATSAALAANALVVGGGAGAAPSTVTTGTGVLTALGVNTGTAGAFVVNGGALGTPSGGTLTNCTGLPVAGITGTLLASQGGTGVANGASCTLTLPNEATTITTGGTIALGGFTLTVPATGTTALREAANTFTAAQTISTGADVATNLRVLNAAGTQPRFQAGTLASSTSYGGIYLGNVTPSSGNFTLIGDGTTTYINGASSVRFAINGSDSVRVGSAGVQIDSGKTVDWNNDTYLIRKAAATLQLGLDAAVVTNQTFTAANRITSDGVGANLTIAAGNGRGGAGGTLILSTFDTAGAGTAGTLRSRMTFDTAGAVAFPVVTAVTTETVVSDTTWPVTINGVAYKICLKA